MDNRAVVERIMKNLAFDLETVPKTRRGDNCTSSSKTDPLNLKIRVRKKEISTEPQNQGFISNNQSEPEMVLQKVRLVNSDETIMSFDMFMEADFEKKVTRKPRKHIFDKLKPGICLGAADDDDQPYMPNSGYSGNADGSSSPKKTNEKDGILRQPFTLLKNNCETFGDSNIHRKEKYFLGRKCKPGGCLDPPFGEDKYAYKPCVPEPIHNSKKIEPIKVIKEMATNVKPDIKPPERKKLKSKDLSIKSGEDKVKQNASLLSLYIAESPKNSVITYPPEEDCKALRTRVASEGDESKIYKSRPSSEDKSKQSVNDSLNSFFSLPKGVIKGSNTSTPRDPTKRHSYSPKTLRNKPMEYVKTPVPFSVSLDSVPLEQTDVENIDDLKLSHDKPAQIESVHEYKEHVKEKTMLPFVLPLPIPIPILSRMNENEDSATVSSSSNIKNIDSSSTAGKEISMQSINPTDSSFHTAPKLELKIVDKISDPSFDTISSVKDSNSKSLEEIKNSDIDNKNKVIQPTLDTLNVAEKFLQKPIEKNDTIRNKDEQKQIENLKDNPNALSTQEKIIVPSKTRIRETNNTLDIQGPTDKPLENKQFEYTQQQIKIPPDSKTSDIDYSPKKLEEPIEDKRVEPIKANVINIKEPPKLLTNTVEHHVLQPIEHKLSKSKSQDSSYKDTKNESNKNENLYMSSDEVIDINLKQEVQTASIFDDTKEMPDKSDEQACEENKAIINILPDAKLLTKSSIVNNLNKNRLSTDKAKQLFHEKDEINERFNVLKPVKNDENLPQDINPERKEDSNSPVKTILNKIPRIPDNLDVGISESTIESRENIPKDSNKLISLPLALNVDEQPTKFKRKISPDRGTPLSKGRFSLDSTNSPLDKLSLDRGSLIDKGQISADIPILSDKKRLSADRSPPLDKKRFSADRRPSLDKAQNSSDRGSSLDKSRNSPDRGPSIDKTRYSSNLGPSIDKTRISPDRGTSKDKVQISPDRSPSLDKTRKSPDRGPSLDKTRKSPDRGPSVDKTRNSPDRGHSLDKGHLTAERVAVKDKRISLDRGSYNKKTISPDRGSEKDYRKLSPDRHSVKDYKGVSSDKGRVLLSVTQKPANEIETGDQLQEILLSPSDILSNDLSTVSLDLAFHSYVNSQNERILSTVDVKNKIKRYPNDSIIFIRSQIKLNSKDNNEFNIPIDPKLDMAIEIKKNDEIFKVVNSKTEIKPITKHAETDAPARSQRSTSKTRSSNQKVQIKTNENDKVCNTLSNIYEQELVPLQTIIRDLKQEIDTLTAQQIGFKKKVICQKKAKPRLTHSNKRCG